MLRNELETLKQFVETHDSEAEAKLDQLISKDNELQNEVAILRNEFETLKTFVETLVETHDPEGSGFWG